MFGIVTMFLNCSSINNHKKICLNEIVSYGKYMINKNIISGDSTIWYLNKSGTSSYFVKINDFVKTSKVGTWCIFITENSDTVLEFKVNCIVDYRDESQFYDTLKNIVEEHIISKITINSFSEIADSPSILHTDSIKWKMF